MTLAELGVSLSISSLVMMSVAGLMLVSAKNTREMLGKTRASDLRRFALDKSTAKLARARAGSCAVSPDKRRVEFQDIEGGGKASALYLAAGNLCYAKDAAAGAPPERLVSGLDEVSFTLAGTGGMIEVKARTAAPMGRGWTDLQESSATVRLRN